MQYKYSEDLLTPDQMYFCTNRNSCLIQPTYKLDTKEQEESGDFIPRILVQDEEEGGKTVTRTRTRTRT